MAAEGGRETEKMNEQDLAQFTSTTPSLLVTAPPRYLARMSSPPRTLVKYLVLLGHGTRREVEALFAQGRVTDTAGGRLPPTESLNRTPHDAIRVDGAPLDPAPGSVLLLHKPAGLVCSTSDRAPLVYDLLPPRLRRRTPVMAPVGRLDRETTGLLLLTDDGPLLHRLTSPRSHVPKRYRVTLAAPLTGTEAARFAEGTLQLDGERTPLRPALLEPLDEREAWLTITEGRYHQVRRMFAAVGNHVRALHRDAVGPITLGPVAEGDWRVLTPEERTALERALHAARAARGDGRPDLSTDCVTGALPPAP
jgi:16S rRNA pseudouridine516 synthase